MHEDIIIMAIKANLVEVVDYIMTRKPLDLNTLLCEYMVMNFANQYELIMTLARWGIKYRGSVYPSLVHMVVDKNDIRILRLLAELGANFDQLDLYGRSVLQKIKVRFVSEQSTRVKNELRLMHDFVQELSFHAHE